MSTDIQRLDDTVAALTQEGQPFALNTVTLEGVEYRNYANMQRNLGEYYQVMLAHADKEFVVYRDERYTFAQGYQHSAE
ncbi:MAG: long-chain fatty acid--CoA ligase, partial [Halioglobus sp.]|nr:long-chain fatty acid--CoA ligase [Halioglobus sp.]